ncbi:MAG TPA: aminoacyl-tRNA hydrolase [Mesorhizobium sp.]
MFLIAGLGNPGSKYANNRHNVGFMAADAIARRHSFSPWTRKFQAEIAEGRIAGEKVLLIKPQTFMNLSGQAVGEAMRFYKIDLSAVSVLYDEIDLAAGKLRIKMGGGAGGHNGIRALDQHIGKEYRRVRIGVGHPGVKELVHSHVLGDFAKADREWLEPLLDAIADNAEMLIRGDDSGLMNKAAVALGGGSKSGAPDSRPAIGSSGGKETPPKSKGQSHIRQARPQAPAVKLPESGPMAAMLKKLFGKGGD